ncbi:MAG TPA: regulatory protein RecX [Clostridiaceae bacterium]|nr:regulatory protein RecX [Clostridiaceae bacterium]
MKITAIERNKKNKDRFTVFVDNQPSFTISEEDYLSLNLYEEREITDDEIDYIKNEVNFRRAKSAAVKYLSMKLRNEKEVYLKLLNEGYDSKTADRVVEELKSLGYINDKLYVQKYIFDRSKLKPKSKRLLKLELLNKGIREEDIDEVMADWKPDESVIAENLARKKFGKYDLRDEKIVKRIISFLHHRGFSYEMINEVIRKIKDGLGY